MNLFHPDECKFEKDEYSCSITEISSFSGLCPPVGWLSSLGRMIRNRDIFKALAIFPLDLSPSNKTKPAIQSIVKLIKYAKKTKAFVVAEDHQLAGGLGSAVAEFLVENFPLPTQLVAIRDKFGESGEPAQLVKKYHIDVEDIVDAAVKGMERK